MCRSPEWPQLRIYILGKFPAFCGICGPAPEDDGIGTNIETKDAPALIRFKRSGTLYMVSYVVSENVVDRSIDFQA